MDDAPIPSDLQEFASLMVEEVLANMRAKIINGGWSIAEQNEMLDCAIAEQGVKQKLRGELRQAADTIEALCEALQATTHELDAMLRCISDRQTHAEMKAVADKARAALGKVQS